MTKRQKNEVFVKMLKEFPKAFGRVSFRERLMLRTAFDYVVEEVQKQTGLEEKHFEDLTRKMLEQQLSDALTRIEEVKADCDFALEGKDVEIMELKQENEQLRNNGFTVSAMTEQQLKAAIEKGEQLEKKLDAAKDLIHQFLIQNPISGWLPKKAENFLKENE